MPVDDQEGRPGGTSTGAGEGGAAREESAGSPAPEPAPRRGWRRRYVTRRNAGLAAVAIAAAVVLLVVVAFLLYRTGQLDNLIERQIKTTLAEYGVRAEIRGFRARLGPRTAELTGVDLYDARTGEKLGHVERIFATVRVEDMYALRLRRDVNLESLELDAPELWVKFDDEGRSNFANLHLPPPRENQRIVFSYATARIAIKNGVVHYGDARHELSGEARNLRALIQPDDLNAPAASRMNRVEVALDNSTLTYDGRPALDNISVDLKARVDQTRAEIQDLTLRSPVAEAHLVGALPDWRNLRYEMQITSTVDLTQVSNTFLTGTALRGAGRFEGKVTGEGDKYQIDGQVASDALAAGNIRLKNLNVNAKASGEGTESYNAQGQAVAELLTAGDFQLNLMQVRGGVMGSGTDFKFLGDLRAAAARSGESSIANLILADAVAEYRDGLLDAGAKSASAADVRAAGARLSGAQASGLRLKMKDAGNFDASAARVQTGAITSKDTKLNGVSASNVTASARGGVTKVETNDVRVAGGEIAGARVGAVNIAGVRLSIYESGRVEGTTADINAGTVAFKGKVGRGYTEGRADNVRLARPVFVVEPSGRYRASADLSLGGGVLGDVPLGAARAAVVATNSEIQLNNFTADAFKGRARGSAVINMARGASRVDATFEGLDVGALVAVLTGRAVPVTGAATGSANLTFPGAEFARATGTLDARLAGETGDDVSGRTPVTGDIGLRANAGLFTVERASLQAGASRLDAKGQFSLEGNSNLQVNLVSEDAAELQRVVVASNLSPKLENALHDYGVDLAGRLEFNGTLGGALTDPVVNGRASLSSLLVNGRDLGSLAATLESDAAATRVTEGRLAARGGGAAQFTANIPRSGKDNVSLEATLDRFDIGGIIAALPLPSLGGAQGAAGAELAAVGPTSGRVKIDGLPGAMSGSADLRAGPGQIRGEPFEEIVAKATFAGSNVTVDTLDARFRSGRVTGTGKYNTEDKGFEFNVKGAGVRLDVVQSLFGVAALRNVGGSFDFTAQGSGVAGKPRTYSVTLDGAGRDVTINGQSAGTLALTGRTENDHVKLQLTTGILGQPQVIAADVNLADERMTTTIRTTLAGADLTQLFATLLPGAGVKLSGRANGTLEAAGPLLDDEGNFDFSALAGKATFNQFTIQVEDVLLVAEDPLVVKFTPNELTFDRTRFTGPNTNLVFGGTAALGAGGRQNFSVDGDLNLRVLNGVSRNNFFAGVARLEARVTGSFEAPRVTGTATVADATVSTLVEDERLTVQNVNGAIRFTADRAEVQNLTGTLGGGRVRVSGGALLAGYRPTQFRLSVAGEQITVPFPRDFRSTADADLVVQGSLGGLTVIGGTVNLRRAEYTEPIELTDFIDRRRAATITEGVGAPGGALGSNVRVDLRVEGRDALVVRNNLADAVGSVSLQLRGRIEEPIISGRITVTRGTINFIRNQRYELTRAIIDLPPSQEIDPVLNVQAESEIKGYRTIVQLTGPLSQLTANVRSEPGLPQADVIALITTGNLSTGDESQSVLSQTGVGTAASLLTETLINAPVQRATDKLFGLNRFELDPLIAGRGGASPTARLTVGRQINRNLSVTYSTNVTTDQNQVLALEYRVSDRISFVAQYQQGPVNTLRSQRDNFSFEIRFRKRF
ncbi:MAG TPA: translocation/assembly module TamB domain-containing protein [Pyrinomonadaceae bacterium]|nr:translocation/assembly module TamB domain-containing protein [Pyrinomonadaceae bacterium]